MTAIAGTDAVDGTTAPDLPGRGPDPLGQKDERAGNSEIFGSFLIDGNEFALSVTAIQEVVNEPVRFEEIPLSPDYMVGLFNLRGVIVPVVDLRKLFHLEPCAEGSAAQMVAIIEYGASCLGLLVDGTSEVFNSRDVERVQFSGDKTTPRKAVIDGVFKLDGGKRIVQILDPYELLGLDKIPNVDSASASHKKQPKKGLRNQCISFRIGEAACAFDMSDIREIVELEDIDNTALASDFTLGAINLRGDTIPVIDFRVYLGTRSATVASDVVNKGYKLIVMTSGDELISVLVDSIDDIISYFDADILPFPMVGLESGHIFKGCITNGRESTVILLGKERLLADERLLTVTRGHGALFAQKGAKGDADAREKGSLRRTFISFMLDGEFALDISEVNEVITFPENLMRPPNIPRHIEGMVNQRGELIPIVNLRQMYGLQAIDSRDAKVLIFSDGTKKYGIMVDAVESIVTISESDAAVMPLVNKRTDVDEIANDVSEAIILKSKAANDRSLMILDLSSVLSRCMS